MPFPTTDPRLRIRGTVVRLFFVSAINLEQRTFAMIMRPIISSVMVCVAGLLLTFEAGAKVDADLHADYADMARYRVSPLTAILKESPKNVAQCPPTSVDASSMNALQNSESDLLRLGADQSNPLVELTIIKPWHIGGAYEIDGRVCHLTVMAKSYNRHGQYISKRTCQAYAKRTGNGVQGDRFVARCYW